jgi:Toastrack DUF4097
MTTHSTPTPPRLDLRIPAGVIEVELEARDTTTVELTAISGGDAAQAAIDATRQELRTAGGQPEVIVHSPEKPGKLRGFGRQPELRLRVIAPLGSTVRASSLTAEIECSAGAHDVNLKTISGEITLGDATGAVKLDSTSGDVRVGRVGGPLQAGSISGDITAGAIGADSRARTMSGDVTIAAAAGSLRASSMSGDIEIGNLVAGEADLSSMSGDIRAAVAPGVRVYLDLKTLSGDANSHLDAGADAPSGPQLTLKASTKSGDVTVSRAAAAVGA